jgi:hypothetical protein
MKKAAFCIFTVAALFSSCSNELDIAADYKEVTVVYGLLSQSDTVHYVQVFRGFLDEDVSALFIAQNPDSVYYDDSLEVKLEAGGQTLILPRIDAAQIGLPRAPGIFVDSPNYVYRFTGSLLENSVYTVTATNKRTGHIVTAQTPIVKDFNIIRPALLPRINFATKSLNDMQWNPAQNGKIYQSIMRFFYQEWHFSTPDDKVLKYVDWPIFNNYTGNDLQYKFDGTDFLRFLGNTLPVDHNIMRMALDQPLEFHFYVGADDLYEYIRVNAAQTGITSLQVTPEYTNVTNGLGIFSSRYFKAKSGIEITDLSKDSLTCGQFTKDLNFLNSLNCD